MEGLTLGSLFSGSGGFELAGQMNGIEPVWASEIAPFPIMVTSKRFPNMKHLGSVTDIDGAEIDPVDIITFGSPCQDISIAGNRDGINEGRRSKLFFEAIRVIKEMRGHDRAKGIPTEKRRPRFIVWENVHGAFSCNEGEDFRTVLDEICKIADESISIPKPGKWEPTGCIMGRNWSVAWRTFDSQYWGVPQRRRRIYIVADFAGQCAGEVLFEQEGVSWHTESFEEAWKTVAGQDARGARRSAEITPPPYR